ncbi:uncharacterized protein LOC128884364 isoform X2 [Hylaeus volcanicus]|uniref:uncharacterized protein LOC128884364 isoform X2 n=1 Tax=Hylaeus volcanicus TaxID=313075 RepID=UPI0023B849E6|nr:uncharacterized protein LOC128884364 isoform X2 [Hylaeus volcanicus]
MIENSMEKDFTPDYDVASSCMLLSSWLTNLKKINDTPSTHYETNITTGSTQFRKNPAIPKFSLIEHEQRILEALCSLLHTHFNMEESRRLMVESANTPESWRPPSFYWQLMRTPITARTFQQLCEKEHRSEFLLAFNQDLLTMETCYTANSEIAKTQKLGRITSNFTIFVRVIVDVIRDFLLQDEQNEIVPEETENMCELLCQTENAYLYSQALLQYLCCWRPDLMGCRRLSYILHRYTRDVRKSAHVASLSWRFTGLENFPTLHGTFTTLQHHASMSDNATSLPYNDICAFSDAITCVLNSFLKYKTLLYPRYFHHNSTKKKSMKRFQPHIKSLHMRTEDTDHVMRKRQRFLSLQETESLDANNTSSCFDLPSKRLIVSSLENSVTSLQYFHPLCGQKNSSDFSSHSRLSFDKTPSHHTQLDFILHTEYSLTSTGNFSKDSCSSNCDNTGKQESVLSPTELTCDDEHSSSSFDLPPASQTGEVWKEEYDRLRYCAQSCPLNAVRDDILLEALYRDFVTPTVLYPSNVLEKVIDLFLNVTTLNAYELVTLQEEFSQILKAESQQVKSSYRQLPGHWTREGAYDLLEHHSLDEQTQEESFCESEMKQMTLTNAFKSRDSSETITPTVRVGLGSAKIGGLSYTQHLNNAVYSSLMTEKLKETYKDSTSSSSCSDKVSKGTGTGSWINSAWQKDTSVVPVTFYKNQFETKNCVSLNASPECNRQGQRIDDALCCNQNMKDLNDSCKRQQHSICLSSSSSVDDFFSPNLTRLTYEAEPETNHRNSNVYKLVVNSTKPSSEWTSTHNLTQIENALLGTSSSTLSLSPMKSKTSNVPSSHHPACLTTTPWSTHHTDVAASQAPVPTNATETMSSDEIYQNVWEPACSLSFYNSSAPLKEKSLSSQTAHVTNHCTFENQFLKKKYSYSNYSTLSLCDSRESPEHTLDSSQQGKNAESPTLTNTSLFTNTQCESSSTTHEEESVTSKTSLKSYLRYSSTPLMKKENQGTDESDSTLQDKIHTLESVLRSNIYGDPQGQQKIGTIDPSFQPNTPTYSRQQFRELHYQIAEYKQSARHDLYTAYSVVRNSKLSKEACAALLFKCSYSFLGATILLAFIQYQILFVNDGKEDPLLNVSPTVLTLFIAISQRYPKKTIVILSLLHSCFQKSHVYYNHTGSISWSNTSSYPSREKKYNNKPTVQSLPHTDIHLQKIKKDCFDFLMFLLCTGYYNGVFNFLRLHMLYVDTCLLRNQLDTIFTCCQPPYTLPFIDSFVLFLHELIYTQKFLDMDQPVNGALRQSIQKFFKETANTLQSHPTCYDILLKIKNINKILLLSIAEQP